MGSGVPGRGRGLAFLYWMMELDSGVGRTAL